MPYSNLALDADRKNGPAARSFAADAHDCIMVTIQTDRPNTSVRREIRAPMASSPRILNRPIDGHRPDTESYANKFGSQSSSLRVLRRQGAAKHKRR